MIYLSFCAFSLCVILAEVFPSFRCFRRFVVVISALFFLWGFYGALCNKYVVFVQMCDVVRFDDLKRKLCIEGVRDYNRSALWKKMIIDVDALESCSDDAIQKRLGIYAGPRFIK